MASTSSGSTIAITRESLEMDIGKTRYLKARCLGMHFKSSSVNWTFERSTYSASGVMAFSANVQSSGTRDQRT